MRFVITGLLFLLPFSTVVGQTNTGEISGVVKDSSGAVLPGATVTATHLDGGTVVERVTDGEGRFFLPALRIGEWNITARLIGFAPQVQKGIVLEVGRTLTIEFALGVEGLSEELVIRTTVPLLQVQTAEISDVIGSINSPCGPTIGCWTAISCSDV